MLLLDKATRIEENTRAVAKEMQVLRMKTVGTNANEERDAFLKKLLEEKTEA